MDKRIHHRGFVSWIEPVSLTLTLATVLSACANYAGIHSDREMATPQSYETQQSLPANDGGRWPVSDWANQFGDTQLQALLDEANAGSPTLEQARARIAAASAFSETARANTMPQVAASYSWTRQRYSENALVPPPYAGSWQSENKGLLSASYELDLWGKNREALRAAVSELEANKAEAEVVRLALDTSIAQTYNELARLYALQGIAQHEVDERTQIVRITAGRVAYGLDTEVERKTAEANLASSRSMLSAIAGRMVVIRYQVAALLGKGPDRGLSITRPQFGIFDTVYLPANLPADLVSRRPDIVAVRWRVDAMTHGIKGAKAEFYPDINLSVSLGLDAFGFGRFLTAASRTVSAGPAIHLPIFDAGALRAQLKGRYAEFDYAVATYNQTLVRALSDVATRLTQIRSIDAQLVDANTAEDAAHSAQRLAFTQFGAGLANQLTVLNAETNALAAERAVVNLQMDRRDQQIALAAALGGGYTDTSPGTPAAR
jgi:NodT family efflux transporter outer membrane factor (OMF) lipoprotein